MTEPAELPEPELVPYAVGADGTPVAAPLPAPGGPLTSTGVFALIPEEFG